MFILFTWRSTLAFRAKPQQKPPVCHYRWQPILESDASTSRLNQALFLVRLRALLIPPLSGKQSLATDQLMDLPEFYVETSKYSCSILKSGNMRYGYIIWPRPILS